MESFGRENAFGILQQQHVHSHRKIHKLNACHNIPRGKTQKVFYNSPQLTVTVTNFDIRSVNALDPAVG